MWWGLNIEVKMPLGTRASPYWSTEGLPTHVHPEREQVMLQVPGPCHPVGIEFPMLFAAAWASTGYCEPQGECEAVDGKIPLPLSLCVHKQIHLK